MSDQQDGLIQTFCDLTQADPQQARHFLEASNWDVMVAVDQYYAGGGEDAGDMGDLSADDMDTREPSPPSNPQTTAPKSSSSKSSNPKKLVTLGDLSRNAHAEDDDDEDDEKDQDYFAGGEKSGLALKNPADNRKGAIEDMLKKAARDHSRRPEDEPAAGPSRPRFSGSGQTLGSDDTPSVTVPDPNARASREDEVVRRELTFWRDGFSVDDGPLLRYDDPANASVLQAIQAGRAPVELLKVAHGQKADVHVNKRLDEDYVPPKNKRAPFSGTGMRLGSPTPGVSSSSAKPPSQPAPAPSSAAKPVPAVAVDDSTPTTTLRIRLGDGTSLISRFNHTHTVGEVYAFVNAASLESRSRNYVLQTTFPNKELKEHEKTLKEAGLVNANVVQKWV